MFNSLIPLKQGLKQEDWGSTEEIEMLFNSLIPLKQGLKLPVTHIIVSPFQTV